MKILTSYAFLLLFVVIIQITAARQEGKLLMVQELFRHGSRFPGQVLGIGDEYAGMEQSLGELTSQGKAMHYLLGKKLYEVYWDKLFADTPFQFRYNQSKFLIKSTNYNRTIESAKSHI
jgi:hypothetical protein